MPVSLDEFVKRLADSGLIPEEELRALVESLSGPSPPTSGKELAELLVKRSKITPFQALHVEDGRHESLILGNYILLDKLGQGGMGMVLKAEHKRMKRIVALKVLSPAITQTPDVLKRFQREVEAAARLEHINIVRAYDADEHRDVHFLVMEYVDGQDLTTLVRREGPLALADAIDQIVQAALGLDYAHGQGIIHRDVKPSNLLLDKNGTIKILDMGLARIDAAIAEYNSELTGAGAVMGTIDYMSPEQALDTRLADARADQYSLGCTLFFLLTGRCLYAGDSAMQKLLAHREAPIPSLSQARADVPPELDAIFTRMVAKKPEDRYPSLAQVIEDLTTLRGGDGFGAEHGDPRRAVARRPERGGMASATEVLAKPGAVAAPVSEATVSIIEPAAETRSWADPLPGDALKEFPVGSHFPASGAAPFVGDVRPSLWKRPMVLVGIGSLVALLGLAAMAPLLLRVETEVGTIVLEIDQPEIAGAEVTVDGQKKITIKPGRQQEPIEVVADQQEHTLRVTKGGFEAFTDRFTVSEGENVRVRVRLDRTPKEPVDAPPQPSPPPVVRTPETEPNRAAARWVLDQGGAVIVRNAAGQQQLQAGAKLPDGPLEVVHVNLTGVRTVSDDDLIRFRGLKKLFGLSVNDTRFTAPKLLDLVEQCPNILDLGMNDLPLTAVDAHRLGRRTLLRTVGCYGCGLDDAGVEPIVLLPQLVSLNLGLTRISDATLEKLSGREHLAMLTLARTNVTDVGLKSLANCKKMRQLNVVDTKVSEQGVRELSQALPKCTITWQGGQLGPPPPSPAAPALPPPPELPPIPLRRTTEAPIPLVDFRRWPRNPDKQRYEKRGIEFDAMVWKGTVQTVADVWARDVTLRARLRLHDAKEGGAALFAARSVYPDNSLPCVLYYVGLKEGSYTLSMHNGKLPRFQELRRVPMPSPAADGFWDVEFSIRGTRMTAKINGELLAEAEDDLATEAGRLSLGGGTVRAEWADPVIILHDPPEQIREGTWLGDAELSVNGADNVVVIPTLARTEQKSFTVEAWVTPGSIGKAGAHLVGVAGPAALTLFADSNRKLAATVHYATPEQPQSKTTTVGGTLPGKRTHVACVLEERAEDLLLRLFIDGKNVAEQVVPGKHPSDAPTGASMFGADFREKTNYFAMPMRGRIDEIRISSVARYLADFSPQTRFAADPETLALYHCDETHGGPLVDSSGNGHHGQVMGATWIAADTSNESSQGDLTP